MSEKVTALNSTPKVTLDYKTRFKKDEFNIHKTRLKG